MKSYFQNDHGATEEHFVAQLTIAVSEDGEFVFGYNWESDEMGIRSIAAIFYGIAHEQLTDQILSHLKSQCVLEGNQEDFLSIVNLMQQFTPKDSSGQAIAVPPRNASKM
jgi:hypothetical protein